MKKRGLHPVSAIAAALAVAIIALPLIALLIKVPYSQLFSALTADGSMAAVKLSLWTSIVAALVSLLLGVPLAWWLSQTSSKIAHFIRPLILAPIALPPTVAGLALLGLLSRQGLLGSAIFRATGWQMPFTTWAVIFAGIFIGMPFLILISESSFRQVPRDIEDAAVMDRASDDQLLRLIAIPQARSGIITGLALAWARILGEFGATMMFAGSMPGSTQTWTLQIYQELDINPDSAYALSFFMFAIAMVIVIILRKSLREAFAR